MAQGLEVLQAALAGKRVRFLSHLNGQWGTWKDLAGLQNWGIHRLFDHEWEIEDPTLTFTEAVAAMDAGQTVEHAECLFRKRTGVSAYEYKAYDDLGWIEADFGFEDVHATDWRVVREDPKDDLKRVPLTCAQILEVLEAVRDRVSVLEERQDFQKRRGNTEAVTALRQALAHLLDADLALTNGYREGGQ